MRIDEIKNDLWNHYTIIKNVPQPKDLTGSKKSITGLRLYMTSVRYLSENYEDAFPSIAELKKRYNLLFYWSQDEITADSGDMSNYINLLKRICAELEQNLGLLDIISPTLADGYYLKIKLPEVSTPSQLVKFFDDINYVLEQIDKHYGTAAGDFELYDFQHGSKWTDFFVRSGVLLTNLLLIIELTNGAFELTENIRNTINYVNQNKTESSDLYLDELEKKKKEILYTETQKFVEQHFTEETNSGDKQVIINTTTKIIEKTTFILERGGAFQVEIVNDSGTIEDDILAIEEDLQRQVTALNAKQLEISNSLNYVPAYPQLSLPESQETIKAVETETNNN